jgi:hypothetical protein
MRIDEWLPTPLMTRKRHWEVIADVLWSLKHKPGIDQSTLEMIAWTFAERLTLERYLKGGTGFDYQRFIADATARPTPTQSETLAEWVRTVGSR